MGMLPKVKTEISIANQFLNKVEHKDNLVAVILNTSLV